MDMNLHASMQKSAKPLHIVLPIEIEQYVREIAPRGQISSYFLKLVEQERKQRAREEARFALQNPTDLGKPSNAVEELRTIRHERAVKFHVTSDDQ